MSVPWLRLAQRPERRSSPCSSPLPTGSGWSPPTRRPSAATRDRGCARLGRPVDEDAADFAGLSCAGASGRELLVVGLVDLVVGVLVGAVDEDAADLAGLNSGVGGVACQGLVGGLVEGLMEVIVRFLVGAVDDGAAERAAVQRPLGGILSESRRSLVSVMPRSLRVIGRLDSSAAANPSLASSWSACLNPVARASTGSPDGRRLLRSPHVPWQPRWSCAVVAPPSGDGRISD
jgi:hypothetical protein